MCISNHPGLTGECTGALLGTFLVQEDPGAAPRARQERCVSHTAAQTHAFVGVQRQTEAGGHLFRHSFFITKKKKKPVLPLEGKSIRLRPHPSASVFGKLGLNHPETSRLQIMPSGGEGRSHSPAPGSVYQTPHTDTASFRSNRSHAMSERNRGIKQTPPPHPPSLFGMRCRRGACSAAAL